MEKFLKKHKIFNRYNFIDLKYGTTFINNNSGEIYYSIGSVVNDTIELKSISKREYTIKSKGNKIVKEAKRNRPSINVLARDYKICEIDMLGKIVKTIKISDILK